MRKFLLVLALLLSTIAVFVAHIFTSTGYFRAILPSDNDRILGKIDIAGAEDIEISRDAGFAIISSDDRAARRDGNAIQGALYYLDLEKEDATPISLTADFAKPFFPHGISMLQIDSANYRVWVINHFDNQHSIEVFDFNGSTLTHKNTLMDAAIMSPNDIVALDEQRFYFTNDHGNTSKLGLLAENYLGLRASNVVYYNGSDYKEVAREIAYANGINYDPNRNLLFVASPRDFLVKVYSKAENGDLDFIEDIMANTGVDNIEFDEDGKLWIGCHPNLLKFSAYAGGKTPISPSEVICISYKETGDYVVITEFLDNGENMSAATVAIPYKGKIYLGNVMDKHMLVISQK
jgi:arylesterase/paraoxonase